MVIYVCKCLASWCCLWAWGWPLKPSLTVIPFNLEAGLNVTDVRTFFFSKLKIKSTALVLESFSWRASPVILLLQACLHSLCCSGCTVEVPVVALLVSSWEFYWKTTFMVRGRCPQACEESRVWPLSALWKRSADEETEWRNSPNLSQKASHTIF